ncbi:unnamed protein product [marine sediment metagenome]|uniref:Uncharacterized protein n=1 Tax=marine sediment metagenome TaxID=412755 RepID=X1DDA9_9ZZZZ
MWLCEETNMVTRISVTKEVTIEVWAKDRQDAEDKATSIFLKIPEVRRVR